MRNPELWQRLEKAPVTLSDGSDLGVVLADRFDIRPAVVAALMTEYRRFLYLAASSDQLLVPSRAVDQVWEVHMADQPAWAEFSRRIFGEALEGIPARSRPSGNPAYQRTLDLLRQEFGATPKPPIWPTEHDFASRAGRSAFIGIFGIMASIAITFGISIGVGVMIFVFSVAALAFGAPGDKQFALPTRSRDGVSGGDFGGSSGGETRQQAQEPCRPGFTDYREERAPRSNIHRNDGGGAFDGGGADTGGD